MSWTEKLPSELLKSATVPKLSIRVAMISRGRRAVKGDNFVQHNSLSKSFVLPILLGTYYTDFVTNVTKSVILPSPINLIPSAHAPLFPQPWSRAAK